MVARTTTAPTSILGDAIELAPLFLGVADADAEVDAVVEAAAEVAASAAGATALAGEAVAALSAGVRSMGSMRGVLETELRSMELSDLRTSEFMARTPRVNRTFVAKRLCDHSGRADMSKLAPHELAALSDEVMLLLYAA